MPSLRLKNAGGGGPGGLTKVADAPARLALTPGDGFAVLQLDTDEIWVWDITTMSWLMVGSPDILTIIQDTNSVDLVKTLHTLSANLKLSAAAAPANNQLVTADIQADGLRAYIADSQIRGLVSATSPVLYNNTTGVISIPVATDSVNGYFSSADHTALTNVIADFAAHIIAADPHSQYATDTDLSNHLSDATAAHAASAVSFSPTGNIVATDVQAAIAGVDSETDSRLDSLESATHAAVTTGAFGSTPNSKGLTLSGQVLNLEPADATNPGAVSLASQAFTGEKRFPTGAQIGAATGLAANVIFGVESTTKAAVPAPIMTSSQRNAVGTPSEGLQIYNSTESRMEVYNGTNWEAVAGYNVIGAATIADAGTLTIGKYRSQIIQLSGSGGAATIASVVHTAVKEGSTVIIIGGSDTNSISFDSAANLILNGSCTLGINDQLHLVKVGTALVEVARSE